VENHLSTTLVMPVWTASPNGSHSLSKKHDFRRSDHTNLKRKANLRKHPLNKENNPVHT
jgi:hypothetical protein